MSSKFTKHQIDTAVQVLMETDLINNWALGVLKSYGISKDSPEGEKFLAERRKKLAEQIVSSAG